MYIIILNSLEYELIHKASRISSFVPIHDTQHDILRDSVRCLVAELVRTCSTWSESYMGPMKVNSP